MSDEVSARKGGSDATPCVDDYVQLVETIGELWTNLMRPGGIPLTTRVKDVNDAVAVLGLATHAIRLAAQIARMIRAELGWAVAPLVRLCFECGITAQWVRHVPDGFPAFAHEAYRLRRNFIDAIEKSSLTVDEPVVDVVGNPEAEWLTETSSAAGARNFEQRCKDLVPGGNEYYVMYRYLCMTSHADPSLVDEYFTADPCCGDEIPTYVPYQNRASTLVLAHLTAASAVWSGRTVGMVLKQSSQLKEFRSELRRAAHVLEIQPDLKLSEKAWIRTHTHVRPRKATERGTDARP